MLYHRDSRRNGLLERKNIALVALVAISAFALLYQPVRSTLTQMVYAVAPSVWGSGDTTAGVWNSFVTNIRNKGSLAKENEVLRAEINRMQAQVLDRNLLAEKVASLEGTLGRVKSDDRVAANVIAGPGWAPYDTLVIDAGSDNGIAVGNMVVYSGSGTIGEIMEVSPSSAKVKLYSSPGEAHPVVVGPRYISTIASGRGMGNFEAKVPQNSLVAVGDNVISTKGNLMLGTVSLVEEKPAEPFKHLYFREPFNITEVRSVEVIIGKNL